MEAAAARRLPASPRSSSPIGQAVRGRSRGEDVANRATRVHTTRESRRVIHVSAPRAKDAGGLGHLSDPLNHAGLRILQADVDHEGLQQPVPVDDGLNGEPGGLGGRPASGPGWLMTLRSGCLRGEGSRPPPEHIHVRRSQHLSDVTIFNTLPSPGLSHVISTRSLIPTIMVCCIDGSVAVDAANTTSRAPPRAAAHTAAQSAGPS